MSKSPKLVLLQKCPQKKIKLVFPLKFPLKTWEFPNFSSVFLPRFFLKAEAERNRSPPAPREADLGRLKNRFYHGKIVG
jgi:hypothetical protein